MPDEKQIVDLGNLAIERCQHAYQSVTQLVDKPSEAYCIGLMVIVAMMRGMGKIMQDDVEDDTGNRPSDDTAIAHTLEHVLDGLGVAWKKQSVSRTQSTKK